MQRKEIFKKLEKDLEPKAEYNYRKTTKGIHIMKKRNEVSEKEILKQILNRLNEFEKNQLKFNNKQLEFNKAIMQRLDNIVNKNNLSE